ncbi:MAG: deoxyguanosinetriphosphate triphosphohydrolase [Phycisphaerae bacterium]
MTSDTPSPRELFETAQDARLSSAAVRERDSGGRRTPEQPHAYRTCFQRDRDRVMHCSAFRRLDFKTQVFVPHTCDHFRTRLTHTLEVAQIARDLSRAMRLNEDLAEAVALAHDLGHPPFGHAGEQALADLMADHGCFEHNRQSLRIVDYLEHPYPDFRGLNLTMAVRECIAKHETRYDTPVCEDFDTTQMAPLEGQLVDLADEIAYTAADLDDALQMRLVTAESLAGLSLWREAMCRVEARWGQARPIHKEIRCCKEVLAMLADDLIVTTAQHMEALNVDSPRAARQAGHKCVTFSSHMRENLSEMQDYLLRNVYTSEGNIRQDERAGQVIRELFAAYLSRPELLPHRYQKRSNEDGLHRVICDYIAGMTDRFCNEEYTRICSR